MNNYNGYVLAKYAGDYLLEDNENHVVLPLNPANNDKEEFYGIFALVKVIPYGSKEAKELNIDLWGE